MTIRTEYDHPSNPPVADELATCIAMLQGAKIRAQAHISNPWGLSWLEEPEQQLIDCASDAIDLAVAKLEALREALKR
ncbi:hypothetical protein QUB36_28290 [Microcoleus sp. AT8-B1]|uniref:hypothetical protein n=1 Tax=unclassified Microcoleus TaxID=2642155 RepID=UPI002FD190A1